MYKVIAIVGPIGAGKTTIAKLIEGEGYKHLKLSESLYQEADERKLDRKNRQVLQDLGDDLRAKNGPGVLAKMMIEKMKTMAEDKFVVESIRNHHELETLQQEYGNDILTIAVQAPLETRYIRAVERKGQYKENEMSLDEFKKINERDLGESGKENEQNVRKCMEMADVEIVNEGSLEELRGKIKAMIR